MYSYIGDSLFPDSIILIIEFWYSTYYTLLQFVLKVSLLDSGPTIHATCLILFWLNVIFSLNYCFPEHYDKLKTIYQDLIAIQKYTAWDSVETIAYKLKQ